jgi:hypothetical protein
MALYNNLSMDEYNRMAARAKRDAAEKAAQNLANRQAAVQAANKKTGGLVDTLVGIGTGIKDKVVDAGATLANIGKTFVGGLEELIADNDTKNTMSGDSKRRNEIAQKYGYASYSDAANDDNASQDFWNEIKSSNKKTQDTLKADRKTYENSVGNVQDINLNKAAGQALNTIDTVGMALGGGAGVAANILGGGLAGIGDQYKADAERGKTTLDLGNFSLKNAATGMAGGAAGSLAGGVLGKAATKASNPLTKALTSQLGQGIGSGAAAGAAGGFTGTLTQGGSLQDALANALEGAKGGAIGGGVMAGATGLAGRGLNRLQNGRTANTVESEPVDAQIVAKNKVQAPQARAIEAEIVEPANNRRGIAIKDLNAGVEEIPVRTAVETPSRGKYIDSVVAGKNLPEAKIPTSDERFTTYWGDSLKNIVANGDMGEGADLVKTLQSAGVSKADIEALRNGAATNAADNNTFGAYGMNSREDLPTLNRQEYYADRTGRPGASVTSEDIPAYMQDRMRNDAGRGFGSSSDNESIMREVFGGNMDKEQMYDLYEQLAQTTQNPTYTAENFGAALAFDPELNARVTQAFLDQYNPTRKIQVQGGPAISDNIPVADRTTRYAENTLPARTYEQPTARENKVMNAEPTTVKATPTTTAVAEPEIDYITEVQRQKAQIAADKAKRQAIGGVIEQYGTTRLSDRIEGLPTAIEDMLDLGLTDRAEIELFSKKLASGDSEISKAIRKSLNEATPIDGKWGFTWEDVFNAAGAANNEAAQKQIKSFYESQAKKLLKADENGQFNRNDVYDFGKALEKEGYKKYDRGVRNQNTNTQVYGEALINMSQDIIGKATDGVDVSGKFNANKLKNLLPGNEAWAGKVDALSANAKTVQDLRSAMASATKMNLLKQAEEYNINTFGQNQGDKGKGGAVAKAAKAILTGKPLSAAEAGTELVLGSDKAKQKAIKKSYENYKKYQAQANGETPTTPAGKLSGVKQTIADKTGKVGETAKNIASKTAEKVGKATAGLNDTTLSGMALGGSTVGDMLTKATNRSIAKDQAEFANNRANVAQKTAEFEQAANDYTQAIAEQQAAENQLAQGASGASGSANMLARINNAMELAMQAGDINAYSQLADLYKQAYNIYEMQNPQTKNEGKALSTNQSKALAASQQLEQLAQMTPNAGTVASTIPVLGGIVDLTGGNEYANQAEALATTLGYLLSGANIKESEAKRIGQSYVPNAFDSEAVRQQKLDRARQLIQSYMSDTGAIQQ